MQTIEWTFAVDDQKPWRDKATCTFEFDEPNCWSKAFDLVNAPRDDSATEISSGSQSQTVSLSSTVSSTSSIVSPSSPVPSSSNRPSDHPTPHGPLTQQRLGLGLGIGLGLSVLLCCTLSYFMWRRSRGRSSREQILAGGNDAAANQPSELPQDMHGTEIAATTHGRDNTRQTAELDSTSKPAEMSGQGRQVVELPA